MYFLYCLKFTLVVFWLQGATCMNFGYSSDYDIAQLLNAKAYLPENKDFPKTPITKTSGKDATHILSKLTDSELIKLLNEFSKRNEYDMDDIIKVSTDAKKNIFDEDRRITGLNAKVENEPESPIFRLENKAVDPFAVNRDADPKYNAYQKLNNILYSRPRESISAEDDKEKEKMFDFLVSQLKTLCCKKNKIKNVNTSSDPKHEGKLKKQTEYIFLVLNDEIKSNNISDEVISVDPESLSENSKVLLLGPILNPLTDVQTKLVMNRISKELSRPEYTSLLKNISENSVIKNTDILKSLVSGPNTRRYIKPHRCNHQSKLAKMYNGPKWIICTGYLNINTPSLYD